MLKFLLVCVVAFGFLYSWTGWSATRLGASAKLRGSETFITYDKARDLKIYRVLYPETDHFVVDEYAQTGRDYQRRNKQSKFYTEASAREYLAGFGASQVQEGNEDAEELPISEMDGEVLWVADKEWTLEWENKFAVWVSEKVDVNFHKRFGIATDCADVPMSLRWIFSRINKLPMANTLAGTRRLFTNATVLREWVNLPTSENWYDDRRFFAALNYVLDNTYTHSLMQDSYPIAISAEYFTAGAHHLDLYSERTGHTRLVGKISHELGGIVLMDSTVPRQQRVLMAEIFSDVYGVENISEGGFLKIRWAEIKNGQWGLRARNQMPGYSMEQYSRNFTDDDKYFFRKVLDRLGFVYNPVEMIKNIIVKLQTRLEARVQIVKDGYQYCLSHDCSPGTEGYEAWGTPHRDLVINELIIFYYNIAYESADSKKIFDEFNNTMWSVEGKDVKYAEILYKFYDSRISSDPRDVPLRRWGL